MRKTKLLVVMGAAMVAGLSGCQKSPEESIVANKDFDNMIDEYQRSIDSLQANYENAPKTLEIDKYLSDNQFHSVSDLYNDNPSEYFYEYQYNLNPNGEIFYGVNDAKDGNYISLYAQNNENYGNGLSYRSFKQGYNENSTVMLGQSYMGLWQPDESNIAEHLLINIEPSELKEIDNDPVTISEDQAKQGAEELINSLGLTDFKCYESGLYCELPDIRSGKESNCTYHKEYRFTYMRNIDGAYVNNDGGFKFTENWVGDDYTKKLWGGEKIVVLVNDRGIIGFDYISPIEILETVVDKSNLKTFDEIKSIFEEMSVVVHAKEEELVNIDIERVALRYTRISEADNFDKGLLVPAWDFIGTITSSYDGSNDDEPYIQEDVNVLTINAIDGTIIDRTLGY